MAFDIETFKQHLSKYNEVSRSDKFDVFIPIPEQIADGTSYGIRELSLQCEVSELPARDIQMIEYQHYGFTKRIPHMNQYGRATFTFFCTGDLIEKKLFDRWLDSMVPVDTGLVNYPVDENNQRNYETDIHINQYDTQGNLIYTINLIDAVPTDVGQLVLDWNNDQVHRLMVSFAYRKWTSDQTDYGSDQGGNNDVVSNFTNNFTPTVDNRAPADAQAPTNPNNITSSEPTLATQGGSSIDPSLNPSGALGGGGPGELPPL